MLRILKKHGLDTSDLIFIYIGFVRPVLEYACVIWHPGLTREQSQKIKRVQKRSVRVILGSEYDCYHTALDTTGLSRLDTRRDELCLRFARSLTSSTMNIVYIDYVIVFVMLPAIGVAVSMSSWISKAVFFERELYDWISPDLYIVPLVLASFVCVLVSAGTLYEIIVTTSAGTKSSAESKVGRLLLCFSAYTNTKKVFDTRQLPGQLPFLDGLRVLSALWIILGHMDFYGNVIASIGNRSEHDVRDQEWWFFIIEPYDLAVDTFLVLGEICQPITSPSIIKRQCDWLVF
ncbi:hypothetical protein Bbelb_084140 [Branchiostoma belcheri]|nr:hypothetical protein Bbelb_084140 [Branchiostoma belcheri]